HFGGDRAHAASGSDAHRFRRFKRRPSVLGTEGGPDPDADLRHSPRPADAAAAAGPLRHSRNLGRCPPLVVASPKGPGLMNEVLLRAEDVSIHFGGLKALSHFNLEIRQGDLKGLIGPNGAGKTTGFNVLTGVYAPSSGSVWVGDERVNGWMPHEINHLGLARTFQNIRLFKELSALDNVRVACRAASSHVNQERLFKLRKEAAFGKLDAKFLEASSNYLDWWRAFFRSPTFQRDEEQIR